MSVNQRPRPSLGTLVSYLLTAILLICRVQSSEDDKYLTSEAKSPVSLGDVEVTEGDPAFLPCDMSLPSPDDAIYLVLWFLEPQRKPIYTFDVRGKPLSLGRRWSEVASFGRRADFRFSVQGNAPSQGQLSIANITLQDEGIYRCRVDFKNSPARHFRVKLNVIVPPSVPEISDEQGRVVNSQQIESWLDRFLVLRCRVTGGKPPPELTWFMNDQKIPSQLAETFTSYLQPQLVLMENSKQLTSWMSRSKRQLSTNSVRVEEIRLGPLRRHHQGSRLTCQASNSQMNSPKRASFFLDMQLPPLKANILHADIRFVAGEHAEIRCEAVGSRPAAQITWWKDNERLPDSSHKTMDLENVTTSVLKILLRKEDNGKSLTCRAVNTRLEASAMEDVLRLDVQFAPVATLRLGSTLNADIIKEGDDVYFECSIHANPDSVRLLWKQENRTLNHNTSLGVIMSNQSLVLRGVARRHSGNYTCIGINTRGEGISNRVVLTVRYAPLCQQPLTHIRGADRREFLTLTCSTDSLPSPIKYKWAINTTRGWKDVMATAIDTSSAGETAGILRPANGQTLRFRPEVEADFGTVACWALNDVDWQRDPCLFRISPAGPPESLSNCSLLNQTADSIHVSCQPNHDGGLKQSFQLQALDVSTGTPVMTITSLTPEFSLNSLEPGSTFMLYVYAVNVKGLSPPLIIPVSTLKEAAKRTVPPTTDYFAGNVIGAVAMGTGAGALLTCAITVVACFRCRRSAVPTTVATTSRSNGAVVSIKEDSACEMNGFVPPGNASFRDRQQSSADSTLRRNNHQRTVAHSSLQGIVVDGDADDDDDAASGFYQLPMPIRTGCSTANGSVPTTEPATYLTIYSTTNYLANGSDVPESCV